MAPGGDAPYLARMQITRIARLESRALVRVSGPDARPFLHNLLTQDVETLADGELRFGALLSPPGRLLFDLFLWGADDAVLLDVAADRREALMQRLVMYRLRAKVQITADNAPVHACWDGEAAGFAPDPRRPDLGGRRHGGSPSANASEEDWRAHELALGVPGAPDWPDDRTYPIEANFDLLNGIDFQKGCFVGQETTSRTKRRGSVKSRMLAIAFDGAAPPAGTEILNGELRAGEVLGGQAGRAMALMRLDRLEGALVADGRPVRIFPPAQP